jgi:hypothetical protein
LILIKKNGLNFIASQDLKITSSREITMPTQRKNPRKKSSGKKTNSKKRANPSLKLVLNRLDHIDQRLETLEQNTAAEFKAVREEIVQGRQETAAEFQAVRGEIAQGRQETAAEFQAVRGEIAQGRQETAAEFQAVRGEIAQGRQETAQHFDDLEQRMDVGLQSVRNDVVEHYSKLERKGEAQAEHYEKQHNQLLTAMDSASRKYDEYWRDSQFTTGALRELRHDVEELKKRDMEKAAAIEKIQKEIDKSKAA